MATTLSEAAAEVPAETTLFVQIKKMCALADETYEERARLRAYFAEECRIWGQIAEQIGEAEWHISGQMKELAEQISEAQSSQPADQHDLQHQEHSQLGSNWDEKPAQSAALAAPPVEQAAPVVAAHNTSVEAPKADCNWDVWLLLDKASSNTTSEAEQISEAQSSQPADQHSLQHQQHKREKSANYWRHNTPTTGAAAERRNKRKHAQMKHPERRTLHNKKKKVRQMFNNLWITMLQTISENVGLPQHYWREKNRNDSAVTMEERKAGIEFMKKLEGKLDPLFGHSQH